MAGLTSTDTEELRKLLQDGVIRCAERCLYQSAKWAAEMLNSLPDAELHSPADTEVDSPMADFDTIAPNAFGSQNENFKEARLEAAETPKYLLAKSYFDCHEYDRCAAVFLPLTLPKGYVKDRDQGKNKGKWNASSGDDPLKEIAATKGYPHLSQKALFLALYAKYMAGEKRKDEESQTILGPADGGVTVNRELEGISRALESRFELQQKHDEGQGWLEYLYGIVLAKGKNKEAKKWLIKSVNQCPHNWGAWQELSSLLGSVEELREISPELPQNILSLIFHVYAGQELFQTQPDMFAALKSIKTIFPTSSFLRTQKALLCYHDRDFDKAAHVFSKILASEPLRLDNTDTYSNILFVMEKSSQLSFLAQLATATDKFRPETCCVVGNYYALRAEHEKAVLYFRRALTLDRNFQSAWTLMGHEYVELRNTHAAIECYRRAVDVNRKDYRAWYGLGQTYEILEMALYALYYYERAAAACPQDPKMWTAVGSCLSKLDRWEQAAKAYKRALVTGGYYQSGGASGSFTNRSLRSGDSDPARAAILDPELLYAIAVCYDRLGDAAETEAYLELTLAQEEGPGYTEEEEQAARRVSASASASAAWSGSGSQEKRNATSKGVGSGSGGVGVTATTSKARMWLAKVEFAKDDRAAMRRAYELANELCQDGWEVEEAKALVKEIRARLGEAIG